MSDPFRKVQSGQPLRIPAAAYNAFIDTAVEVKRRQWSTGQRTTPDTLNQGVALVRNETDDVLPRFAIVGLDAPIVLPADNADAFKNKLAFKGVKPTTQDHSGNGRIGILLEPLPAGKIGRACIDGFCAVKIQVDTGSGSGDSGGGDSGGSGGGGSSSPPVKSYRFAAVIDQDATKLKALPPASISGDVQIIWMEDTPSDTSGGGDSGGLSWAIVRIGSCVDLETWVGIIAPHDRNNPPYQGRPIYPVQRAYADDWTQAFADSPHFFKVYESGTAGFLSIDAFNLAEAFLFGGNSDPSDIHVVEPGSVVQIFKTVDSQDPPNPVYFFIRDAFFIRLTEGDPWVELKYTFDDKGWLSGLDVRHLYPNPGAPQEGKPDITITETALLSVSGSNLQLRKIKTDEKGHFHGVTDPPESFGVPVSLDGDGHWIEVVLVDGKNTVRHIGPDTASQSLSNMLSSVVADGEFTLNNVDLNIDEKGHVAATDGTAIVFSADQTWLFWGAPESGSGGAQIKHIGPGDQDSSNKTLTVDYTNGTLTLTPVLVGLDKTGHVTGITNGSAIHLDMIDEKVKTNSSDATSGYLVDKVIGDGTWTQATVAGSQLKIEHIGPNDSPGGIEWQVLGDAWVYGVSGRNSITFDSKGHQQTGVADRVIEITHATPQSEDSTVDPISDASIIDTPGDDTTKTLRITSIPLSLDAKGHVRGAAAATVNHDVVLDLVDEKVKTDSSDPTSGYLADKIIGDDTWTEMITTDEQVQIRHIGPDDSPGGIEWQVLGDAWVYGVSGCNSITFDSKGHQQTGVSDRVLEITHAAPQSEDSTLDPIDSVSMVGSGGTTLRITSKPLSLDAKGHVRGAATSVNHEVSLDLADEKVKTDDTDPTSGHLADKIVGDNTWIQTTVASHQVKIQHVGPDDSPGGVEWQIQGDAWVYGVSGRDSITFDSKGHQQTGVSDRVMEITHAQPQAQDSTLDPIASLSVSGSNLRITSVPASLDNRGHSRSGGASQQNHDLALVAVTVVTGFQVSGNTLQVKTQTIYVPKADSESGWQTVHTGTSC